MSCHYQRVRFSPNRNAFKDELELLEKVRHPNLVQFVGAVTQNIPMMIVVEYHPKVRFPYSFSPSLVPASLSRVLSLIISL